MANDNQAAQDLPAEVNEISAGEKVVLCGSYSYLAMAKQEILH